MDEGCLLIECTFWQLLVAWCLCLLEFFPHLSTFLLNVAAPKLNERADLQVKCRPTVYIQKNTGVTDMEQIQEFERNTMFMSPFHRTQKHKGVLEPRRPEQHLWSHVPRCAGCRSAALRRSLWHHDASASQRNGHHAGVEKNERGGSLYGHAQHHHRQQVTNTHTHTKLSLFTLKFLLMTSLFKHLTADTYIMTFSKISTLYTLETENGFGWTDDASRPKPKKKICGHFCKIVNSSEY